MLNQLVPEITPSLVLLLFSEGMLAFLSPCILPMLPVYLTYLCGSSDFKSDKNRLLINTLGFIAGFSIVFVLLGATASGLGSLISAHRQLLMRVSGGVIILFGLNFIGILNIPLLNRTHSLQVQHSNLNFFSSVLFGAAFSFGWTPCLGAFLGAALMLASNASTLTQGILLLLVFSLGLGVPFLLTAMLWERLQGTIGILKRHFRKIQIFSGTLLIVTGLLLMFGLFDYYMRLFS